MKHAKLIVCVVLLHFFWSVQAVANPYADQLLKILDEFCIDPTEDEIDDLEKGVSSCFEEEYSYKDYQCVSHSAKAAWYFIAYQYSDNPDIAADFLHEAQESYHHCSDTLLYSQAVGDCIDTAIQNKELLKPYFWTRWCNVRFNTLKTEKDENLKDKNQTMEFVVRQFESELLTLAGQ